MVYTLWLMESLRRNGLRLSSFNPFAAYRRHQWQKKNSINPLCALTEPSDVVSALLVSLIKSTGEITKEQKRIVIDVMAKNFSLSEQEAADHFVQSSFLMRDAIDITGILNQMLTPIKGCTDTQMLSLEKMMSDVASENGDVTPNEYQRNLISKTMELLKQHEKQLKMPS